jgi:predicted phosphodiesterase
MLAIISDIHSNTEALNAVLADIAPRNVEQIICLGDVIGYGPEPKTCMDLVLEKVAVTLMGNHDYAVLYEPNKFNIGAEAACFWTRQQLEDEPDAVLRARRWDFLGNMPVKHVLPGEPMGMGELMFVHGSPRRPVNEYVFPDDIYNSLSKIQSVFERISHLCFVGHTHLPGVFVEKPDFYSPEDLEGVFDVDPAHKALINVGSVGQPRDRDPRACYVLVEPKVVRFVRVPYDIDAVIHKVREVGELDEFLGARLKEGR